MNWEIDRGYKLKITVFTPTYNRAYILSNLYHSLQRQTYFDFEWLIVDDGSTDNTHDVVEQWQKEKNFFPIHYYKQENGGKCRAINHALDLAHGELFFTVDSDDYLTDDALEKIAKWEKELPKSNRYCGVAGNLGISPTKTSNTIFPGEYYEGTLFDRYKNVDGERAIVFYTEVHRKFKYPEFPGEKFMTEAVVYNRIAAAGYKIRFYNDIIWIYKYMEDGLTKSGSSVFINNPRGFGLWLQERARFQNYSTLKRTKMYYTFTCDLSSRYKCKLIAESIGAPVPLIRLMSIIHAGRRVFKNTREKNND